MRDARILIIIALEYTKITTNRLALAPELDYDATLRKRYFRFFDTLTQRQNMPHLERPIVPHMRLIESLPNLSLYDA